jgi:hypothetical protein
MATIFIVLCTAFFLINSAISYPPSVLSLVVFCSLCALVIVRPRLIAIALVPLVLIPASIFTVESALTGLVLLSVGPYAVHLPLVMAEFYIDSMRKGNALERTALMRLATGPARGLALLGLFVGSFFETGIWWTLALVIAGVFFWNGWYMLAGVSALVVSALAGWAIAPLVFAALAFLLELIRWTARPPRWSFWFPRPNPLLAPYPWLRLAVCDARMRRGDLIAARKALRGSHPGSHFYQLRLVHLDLEERTYQSGLAAQRIAETAPVPVRPFWLMHHARALSGTAQFEAAQAVYAELLAARTSVTRRLSATLSLLAAENDLASGDPEGARRRVEALLPSLTGAAHYLDRLRACRVGAEGALSYGDEAGARIWLDRASNELAGHRWTRRLINEAAHGRIARLLFGPRGSAHIQMVRFDILERRASQAAGEPERADFERGAFALAMSLACCWDDLVDLLLGEAKAAMGDGEHAKASELGSRALMELDRTRYSLAAQSARTSWSRRFRSGLAVTLDAAYQLQDSRLQAELIEFARVQTLPAANGEVGGEFVLATPPVVKVRGSARLARPGLPGRPPPVEIEDAARRAAGTGAWWLSFWEIDDWLYWSLIPAGDGEIEGGRQSTARGSRLAQHLGELKRCLPVLLPGEDGPEADFRLAASPLLTDAASEIRLSSALGEDLLPAALLAAVRRHYRATGTRLPLAIAPSASLGYVPWSLLVAALDDSAGTLVIQRLLDVCDWALAPSAALLLHAHPSREQSAPLAVAVVDTCATAEFSELPEARRQALSLPPSVSVLGGRHWTSTLATASGLEAQFRRQHQAFTAAFMCHAVRGTPDEPSTGGLLMADSEYGNATVTPGSERSADLQVLQPSTIFEMAARHTPMPAQVLLQACDTSALSDADSGEWLTIAPAFIAAGCREVIATLYPVPDQFDRDDPLMRAAVTGGSLSHAVRDLQRRGLARWTGGQVSAISDTPLGWAAYAPICAYADDVHEPSSGTKPHELVSARCMRVLQDAAKQCREGRAKRLDTGYVLSAYLDESELAYEFDGGGTSLKPSALLWTLGPYALSRFLRYRDPDARPLILPGGAQILLPSILIEAIRAAREAARIDGCLIEPEHIVKYLLARPSAARRVLAFISRLARRHPELTLRGIDHRLADEVARPARVFTNTTTSAPGPGRVAMAEAQQFALTMVELALHDRHEVVLAAASR